MRKVVEKKNGTQKVPLYFYSSSTRRKANITCGLPQISLHKVKYHLP